MCVCGGEERERGGKQWIHDIVCNNITGFGQTTAMLHFLAHGAAWYIPVEHATR